MRNALLIIGGLVLAAFVFGQTADPDTMAVAIVAVVGVFGLVVALLAFIVYQGTREAQAWAARPSPPAPPPVVYPPVAYPPLPQHQAQPPVIIIMPGGGQLPAGGGGWRELGQGGQQDQAAEVLRLLEGKRG